jgi:hypothetical protein
MDVFATAGGAGPGLEWGCVGCALVVSSVVLFLSIYGAVKGSIWTVLVALSPATCVLVLAAVAALTGKPSDDPDEKGSELVGWYMLLWASPGFISALASLVWVLVKGRQLPPPGPPNPFADTSSPEGATGNSQG